MCVCICLHNEIGTIVPYLDPARLWVVHDPWTCGLSRHNIHYQKLFYRISKIRITWNSHIWGFRQIQHARQFRRHFLIHFRTSPLVWVIYKIRISIKTRISRIVKNVFLCDVSIHPTVIYDLKFEETRILWRHTFHLWWRVRYLYQFSATLNINYGELRHRTEKRSSLSYPSFQADNLILLKTYRRLYWIAPIFPGT